MTATIVGGLGYAALLWVGRQRLQLTAFGRDAAPAWSVATVVGQIAAERPPLLRFLAKPRGGHQTVATHRRCHRPLSRSTRYPAKPWATP